MLKRIISILLCLLLCLSLCGCAMIDYKKAVMLYEGGGYEGAKEIFESLGDHEDSAEYAAKAQIVIDYRNAIELYAAENYDEAKLLFENLGDYEKSADYLDKIEAKLAEREEKLLAEKIVGRWKTDGIDMLPVLFEAFGEDFAAMGYTNETFKEAESLNISMYYTFSPYGLVTSEVDPEGIGKLCEFLAVLTKDATINLTEQELQLAAEANGISLEDMLKELGAASVEEYLEQSLGMSVDEYLSAVYNEETIGAVFASASVSGAWYVKDGQIYSEMAKQFEKGEYNAEKDTITMLESQFTEDIDINVSEEELMMVYPFTMTRADEAKPKA